MKKCEENVLQMYSMFKTTSYQFLPKLHQILKSNIGTTKKVAKKEEATDLKTAKLKAPLSKTSTEHITSTFQNYRSGNKLLQKLVEEKDVIMPYGDYFKTSSSGSSSNWHLLLLYGNPLMFFICSKIVVTEFLIHQDPALVSSFYYHFYHYFYHYIIIIIYFLLSISPVQ